MKSVSAKALITLTLTLGCLDRAEDTDDDDDRAEDTDDDNDPAEVEGDEPGECSDGADNDGDGAFDCDDSDCYGSPVCDDDDSGSSAPTFTPVEGDWTFGQGTWISDECEATFLSTPVGWELSDATENGFDLSFQFQEAGSIEAAPSCELRSSDFVCDAVVQKFSFGSVSIVLEANAEGSFSTDTTGTVEVTFDIECTGAGCNSNLAANPCTSVQSFNTFFDG